MRSEVRGARSAWSCSNNRWPCRRREGGSIMHGTLWCAHMMLEGCRGRGGQDSRRAYRGREGGSIRCNVLDGDVNFWNWRCWCCASTRPQSGSTIEVEAMRCCVLRCLIQTLQVTRKLLNLLRYPVETYHLLCPESHLLVWEAMVIVGTTLSSYMAMAVVHFTLSFVRKLFVGHELSITFIIRLRRWWFVLLPRAFSLRF